MSIKYHNLKIDNLNVFYREKGDSSSSETILLLHGFPTSSHMYRSLFSSKYLENYHLIAPDLIGFGNSSMPLVNEFEYSFENLAKIIDKFISTLNLKSFYIYVMDYGAPIGYRYALSNPDKIKGFIVQNGNAYEEGISNPFWDKVREFWKSPNDTKQIEFIKSLLTIETTKWQYLNGVRDPSVISPDNWIIDQHFLDRKGNDEIQLALLYSYSTNPPLYPKFQEYFRKYQPRMLIAWGKNDEIFPSEGAYPYKKDIKDIEFHLFETGHFALEEDSEKISILINNFLSKN